MTAGTIGAALRLLVFCALIAALAGCGSSTQHIPKLADLPLVSGTRVVAQNLKCDKGANAFCGLELVVVGPGSRNSNELLRSEHLHLKSLGWTGANADIDGEWAADSPGHRLHVTFATAATDLTGTGLGMIKRAHAIQVTLSHEIFARMPALSILLEEGSG